MPPIPYYHSLTEIIRISSISFCSTRGHRRVSGKAEIHPQTVINLTTQAEISFKNFCALLSNAAESSLSALLCWKREPAATCLGVLCNCI